MNMTKKMHGLLKSEYRKRERNRLLPPSLSGAPSIGNVVKRNPYFSHVYRWDTGLTTIQRVLCYDLIGRLN